MQLLPQPPSDERRVEVQPPLVVRMACALCHAVHVLGRGLFRAQNHFLALLASLTAASLVKTDLALGRGTAGDHLPQTLVAPATWDPHRQEQLTSWFGATRPIAALASMSLPSACYGAI